LDFQLDAALKANQYLTSHSIPSNATSEIDQGGARTLVLLNSSWEVVEFVGRKLAGCTTGDNCRPAGHFEVDGDQYSEYCRRSNCNSLQKNRKENL
jgi:hypothetical protein